MPVGNFFCNKCKTAFIGEYKPQQRPRKSCPKCHKMTDLQKGIAIPPQIADTKGKGGNGSLTPTKPFTKIDDEMIEESILFLANDGKIDVPLIGKMIEFYYKIRGKDDKIKDNIDMEEFMTIGEALKNSS